MSSASVTGTHPMRPLFAMGARLLSMVVLSCSFALVKLASDRGVHIIEAIFYRQIFSLPVIAVSLWLGPGLAGMRSNRVGMQASRAAIGTIAMALNFGGIVMLPLAEAMTIGFTVPIFATILSVLFLGERPGIHRWAAVFAGFAGVVIIVNPGSSYAAISAVGIGVAMAGAAMTGITNLLIREMGRTENPITTVFYFSVLTIPPLGIAMLFLGKWHDMQTMAILMALGLTGGLAQLLMTTSLRWGSVSLVLPMDYSSLLWSTLLGWLFWSNWPGPSTWAGAIIIAGSSIYIAWRERLHYQAGAAREIATP